MIRVSESKLHSAWWALRLSFGLAPLGKRSPRRDFWQPRPWARAIKAAVVSRTMPPWFADPRFGHFRNERRLTEAEIATLAAWADNGAPEGNAKDMPVPLQSTDGWNIRPDMVFRLPKPLKISAKGTVEYTYVAVAPPFKEDTWVAAGEIRPSDRSHVHHVIAMVRPKGSKWMVQAQLGADPWAPGPTRQADMLKANNGDASVLGYDDTLRHNAFQPMTISDTVVRQVRPHYSVIGIGTGELDGSSQERHTLTKGIAT